MKAILYLSPTIEAGGRDTPAPRTSAQVAASPKVNANNYFRGVPVRLENAGELVEASSLNSTMNQFRSVVHSMIGL